MTIGKSFAVIPAAGTSRRMGRQKLLLPFGNSTVIEQVLDIWKSSDVDEVVVVVREPGELADTCLRAGVQVTIPQSPPPQMKDSVLLALDAIEQREHPDDCSSWLLAPADTPRLSVQIINRLLQERIRHGDEILLPVHRKKHGHPALIPWRLSSAVHGLAADEGVKALFARHPVREIECGPAALALDLDTPDDYRRLRDDDESG